MGKSHELQLQTANIDLDRIGEAQGYVIDAQYLSAAEKDAGSVEPKQYKLAHDSRTILIPQPSNDPNDPLNWSTVRKHITLFIISAIAFLPDYGSATGAVTLIPQAEEWHMTPDTVNHSQVGNVFMLGAGGILVVILSAYVGRLPVLFWFTFIAFLTAIWCAAATTFESFMAARILNGFFSTVAQGGGLMFIKDIFFFHEHARKINIWASFFILSPYLGPLLAAFMITTQKWEIPFWIYTLETGLCLIAIVLFMDETYYDRRIPVEDQPARKSRILRLVGWEQLHSRHLRSTFPQAVMRPVAAILKLPVFLAAFYYFLTFAWVVGINTTLSIFVTPLYDFGPKQIGYFYFTPIVAVLLAEAIGHWVHDFIFRVYTNRHKGRFEPEARLCASWIATPFMLAGLILLGFCLEKKYHYMLTALAWGLYVFGIMITTVGVNAYVLDSYPEGSGEVASWVNFARTTGGFIVSYFQVRWATRKGPEQSFGVQAAICGVAFAILLLLQFYGKRLRAWNGPLEFKTN